MFSPDVFCSNQRDEFDFKLYFSVVVFSSFYTFKGQLLLKVSCIPVKVAIKKCGSIHYICSFSVFVN